MKKKTKEIIQMSFLGIGVIIGVIIVLGLCAIGVVTLVQALSEPGVSEAPDTQSYLDVSENVIGEDGKANFGIKIKLDNSDTSLYIGNIGLQVIYGKIYIGRADIDGNTVADVLIKLPKMFYQDYSIEDDVPVVIASIDRDPTFIRGKDYPEDFPIDEIEITIREVVIYEESNKIRFDVFVRVMENDEDYSIENLQIVQN